MASKFKAGDIVRFKTLDAAPVGVSLRLDQGHTLKVAEEPRSNGGGMLGRYVLNTYDWLDQRTGSCFAHEDDLVLVPSDNLTVPPHDGVSDTDPHQMEVMLRACRDQFTFYAEQHEAKGTPEADAKASVNRAMVARITSVLRGGRA